MTLEVWSVLGNWVAGIGALSAVIVSLYLARSQSLIKLKLSAGERQVITPGEEDIPEVCLVNIVNCSQRPTKITHISWKLGWFKKRNILQLYNIPGCEMLPKTLQEGEEGTFVTPFHYHGNDDDWIISITKTILKNIKRPRLYLFSMKVVVSTSVGQTFSVRVEGNLRDAIYKQYKANK